MHPNKIFHEGDAQRNLAFARERGFGVLAIASNNGLLVSHVPFIVLTDDKSVELHLAKPNPILTELAEPTPCILAVSGPDAYVSPDWYDLDNNQVPTWNYVAVHIRGMLRRLPQEELANLLERTSAEFENRLAPKAPWMVSKMEPCVFARMQRAISPLSIVIEAIEGTWKLGQNRPNEARLNAANAMRSSSVGSEILQLSRLMAEV